MWEEKTRREWTDQRMALKERKQLEWKECGKTESSSNDDKEQRNSNNNDNEQKEWEIITTTAEREGDKQREEQREQQEQVTLWRTNQRKNQRYRLACCMRSDTNHTYGSTDDWVILSTIQCKKLTVYRWMTTKQKGEQQWYRHRHSNHRILEALWPRTENKEEETKKTQKKKNKEEENTEGDLLTEKLITVQEIQECVKLRHVLS